MEAVEQARLAEEARRFIADGRVTKLPYRGPRRALRFTRMNYGRGSRRALSDAAQQEGMGIVANQVGMNIRRFSMANDLRVKYTPLFAADDEKLRLVIAQQAYTYAMQTLEGHKRFWKCTRVPEGYVNHREALESLVNRAQETKAGHRGDRNKQIHVDVCRNHGGYVALRTSIAYRCWRQGECAPDVAKDFELTPAAVRQILSRLVETAWRLGLETLEHQHHSSKRDQTIDAVELACRGVQRSRVWEAKRKRKANGSRQVMAT